MWQMSEVPMRLLGTEVTGADRTPQPILGHLYNSDLLYPSNRQLSATGSACLGKNMVLLKATRVQKAAFSYGERDALPLEQIGFVNWGGGKSSNHSGPLITCPSFLPRNAASMVRLCEPS